MERKASRTLSPAPAPTVPAADHNPPFRLPAAVSSRSAS